MGRGIAQMAAQAGSVVWLFDVQAGAAEAARAALQSTWQTLVGKNRMEASQMEACLARVHLAGALTDLAPCDLVVEAIVERLDVKQRLFADWPPTPRPFRSLRSAPRSSARPSSLGTTSSIRCR